MKTQSSITTRILKGFDDPSFGRKGWEKLLAMNDTIYLTWEYQRTWWEAFQRGRLLLIVAERDHERVDHPISGDPAEALASNFAMDAATLRTALKIVRDSQKQT